MTFRLSQRSLDRMKGVHPDLIRVVRRAIQISPLDFMITEGLRTRAQQAEKVRSGASQTMNSRHLTGHAIDFAVIANGKLSWDWPLYQRVGAAFKEAARLEGVAIVWGGDWKSLRDGPHVELARKSYP